MSPVNVSLHTRNPKYGKLNPGRLIKVPQRLIKRQKHHFINYESIHLIIGHNGNIFLSNISRSQAK